MWTTEKITELCVEYCKKASVNFSAPVEINGRLTRTLGRCSMTKTINGWRATKIEISRQLLETATDECIEAVIGHECAHYVTTELTRKEHGHDYVFKYYCKMMGVDNDKMACNIDLKEKPEKIFKYTIYCSKCGKLVDRKSRACKITKFPEYYISSCCEESVRVSKNW